MLLIPWGAAYAEGTTTSHGISVFGDLKYKSGFRNFDYVNPEAPKGGELRLWGLDNFETLNPFLLKGSKEQWNGLLFDTLMARAIDEPDALYGLVAETATVPDGGGWVAFNLNPRARFSDGSPITAADVVFTYNALIKDGHPSYRILYRDVATVAATGPNKVRFTFKPGRHRDLPTRLATLPVLSRAYYQKVDFKKTTFEPPLGSGAYKVARIEPGRSIVYGRNPDYWARDLPVNRGRYNFDRIRIDYYRDRDVAFQAIFAGAYDFREEFTSKSWATQYDKPPVRDGLILRETLPDETPSGVQAFFFNMRRAKFKDQRVRQALDLAFDYEWTNKNLFFSQYDRTNSMFENSSLAAHGMPDAAELALLEPLRGKIPNEVFERPYKSPVSDGSGKIRRNLRKAVKLLKAAGYRVEKGVLKDKAGAIFTVEFLLFEATFQRIIGPYIRNLKRLGIQASIRVVDVANFKVRSDAFDYDVMIRRFVQPLTPGIEQRNYFGSENADMPGTLNVAGIKDPAVDVLIEKVTSASTRAALVAATRALDRVLMWNNYSLPQWYMGAHNIAYWNKFGRPRVKPKFGLGVVETWWFDSKKAAMIAAGKTPPRPGSAPTPGAAPRP